MLKNKNAMLNKNRKTNVLFSLTFIYAITDERKPTKAKVTRK